MSRSSLVLGAVLFLSLASNAFAADKIWNVPGVINDGIVTVFTCTNGAKTTANVKVEVFDKAGALDVSGNISAAPRATVNLATKSVVGLLGGVDVIMDASILHSGSARITVPSGVYCDAWLISPAGGTPTTMRSLRVIANRQKGD